MNYSPKEKDEYIIPIYLIDAVRTSSETSRPLGVVYHMLGLCTNGISLYKQRYLCINYYKAVPKASSIKLNKQSHLIISITMFPMSSEKHFRLRLINCFWASMLDFIFCQILSDRTVFLIKTIFSHYIRMFRFCLNVHIPLKNTY